MYWPPEPMALEAAKRILNRSNGVDYSSAGSRILCDLTEMIRRHLAGEKMLEENSRWLDPRTRAVTVSPL
jgi:hypothetical protein